MTASTKVDLFTGPWYGPSNRQGKDASHGPAIIALKRIVSRADPDLLPWHAFDNTYNKRLERAMAAIQRKAGIQGTGQCGRATFNVLMHLMREGHKGELAADNVAINLLEDAWAKLHPPVTPIEQVYDAIKYYWETAIAYNAIWHYLQRRPFSTLGVSPWRGGRSDCSEMTTAALYYVRIKCGIFVPDPNGRGYDGWGNSDTQYATNRSRVVHAPYRVGDIVVYGPAYRTRHVAMCIKPGDDSSSEWGSNGSEVAPNVCSLRYRGDLLAVVRPALVPAHN